MKFNDKKISFLDILIKRDSSGILSHNASAAQRCHPNSTSHPKHCLKNIPFVMARRICAILENRNLRQLKKKFKVYIYPEKVVEIGKRKPIKIPQKELRQPKTIGNNNNLTFISIFNPNNPKIFDLVKSGVNTLVGNNVNGFKNIKLIHGKCHPPN